MSQKNPTNIAASIRQRLLNKARIENRPFNELIQYYAMERFLYRFSLSKYSDKFILKGALLFRVWNSDTYRPTKDIDMLGKTDNNESNISTIIREVLSIQVEPDGMNYDIKSLTTGKITEDADYEGIRVSFNGILDTARVYIQIDIGFGDIVYPKPEKEELPCILDLPAPSLLCYSRESAIAEKFETMIKMKEINSRMKDFYDIWLLSRQYTFDPKKLAKAISSTFAKRETVLPEKITAFSEEFAKLKQVQWKAFKNKQAAPEMPDSFLEVVNDISHFLNPIISTIRAKMKN
ncbi:MAG TPA: nucleotidyl transferase AbiEii/AbiGii toxin family protein [Lentisphaeria bacterium]|nr:MAG: hypothetical protein A2Y17_02565 [Clostridiales bacterium GWF2_38_85]HBM17052.1 nucleotidyl transferase AbiEii/AbiGii toxin family protein [Lentisphaeria bacterium]